MNSVRFRIPELVVTVAALARYNYTKFLHPNQSRILRTGRASVIKLIRAKSQPILVGRDRTVVSVFCPPLPLPLVVYAHRMCSGYIKEPFCIDVVIAELYTEISHSVFSLAVIIA